MTQKEFENKIVRAGWYEKYYFYALCLCLIGLSLFLFYDILNHPSRYKGYLLFFYGIYFALLLLGCRTLYLIGNRYKVVVVESNEPIEQKRIIVGDLIAGLGVSYYKSMDTYFTFLYQRKWWTQDMDVHINIGCDKFYISVIGKSHASGFIDFGSAEGLRQKIVSSIKQLLYER